jgi:integrase
VNGQPYRESTNTARFDEAKRVLGLRLGDAAEGCVTDPRLRRIKVAQLLSMVAQNYEVNGHRSLRRLQYASVPLVKRLGHKQALWVTPADLEAYIAWRKKAGTSNATINRELAALRRGYRLARLSRSMPDIPTLKERNVRTGFFEEEQFQALLRHLSEDLKPVFLVAYITGWRVPSEILTRQWRHVDFRAGWLRLEPGETKNDDGRMFPLVRELRAILDRQRARTEALQRATGKIIPWAFHRDGDPIRCFRGAWKSACKKAGLGGRVPHDLRRTAVRNLERAGVSRSVAMKLTGHKTESVYRRYAIVAENDLREAGRRLSGTIPGTIAPAPDSAGSEGGQ